MPSPRLLLVRHGRSAHVHDGSWINASGARQFESLYDAAPIRDDATPPASLIEVSKSADVLLSSDLARGVASARALAPRREPVLSPLLRELKFSLPQWAPRLPLDVWDGLHFLLWSARMVARVDTPETERARLAAEWVDTRATQAQLTLVITHGGFRRLLAMKLMQRGWKLSPGWRRYHNWSAWELTRRSRE